MPSNHSPETDSISPPLKLGVKLVYGAGNIGLIMRSALFGTFTLYLYTTVMGLPSAWVGIASALCLLWDAVIDPYIGRFSDRTEHRLGRRHAPMLWGALVMGIGFWAYMAPPRGLSNPGLFAWLMGTSLLVRTSMSLFGVPYLALGAELSDDYHERTSISGLRGMLSMVGSMAALSLSYVLFFPQTSPGVDPKLNYQSYVWMGLTFGICMSAFALLATVGTLHRRPYLAQAEAASPQTPSRGVRGKGVLSNRSFVRLAASTTLFFIALVLNKSVYLYFLTYRAGITDNAVLTLLEGASFVGGVLGVFVWMRVLRRAEKAAVYAGSTLATAAVMMAAYLWIGEGRYFGVGNVAVMVMGMFLAGFFSSVVLFLPHAMLADVVDEDELAHGRRREGAFFGVFSLCQQAATGIALAVGGILLQAYVGLVPGQGGQSAQTTLRIAGLFGFVPAVLLIAAAALTWGYALSYRRVGDIQEALRRSRAEGRAFPRTR